MACVNVVAADTDDEARRLFTSLQQFFIGVISGKRQLLQPPVDSMDGIWNIYEEEAVKQMLGYAFIGGTKKLKKDMQNFINKTGVDEVMATSHIFSHEAKMRSFELFAEVFK